MGWAFESISYLDVFYYPEVRSLQCQTPCSPISGSKQWGKLSIDRIMESWESGATADFLSLVLITPILFHGSETNAEVDRQIHFEKEFNAFSIKLLSSDPLRFLKSIDVSLSKALHKEIYVHHRPGVCLSYSC